MSVRLWHPSCTPRTFTMSNLNSLPSSSNELLLLSCPSSHHTLSHADTLVVYLVSLFTSSSHWVLPCWPPNSSQTSPSQSIVSSPHTRLFPYWSPCLQPLWFQASFPNLSRRIIIKLCLVLMFPYLHASLDFQGFWMKFKLINWP